MRKHLIYLNYLARHKWFVFVAGHALGVPFWRLIKHDWTKFLPCEWRPYIRHFYGGVAAPAAYDQAWNHHIHLNDHHWEHWVVYRGSDRVTALEMPRIAVLEMVADWLSMGRTLNGVWGDPTWYNTNRHKMLLHPRTARLVEELIYASFDAFTVAA